MRASRRENARVTVDWNSENDPFHNAILRPGSAHYSRMNIRAIPPKLDSQESFSTTAYLAAAGPTIDEFLQKSTLTICQKYSIAFALLSQIQRKFLTHYRCHACGLLPLYYLNLAHLRRVRCKRCGQLVAFTSKGKYGKLRKEIAFELMKVIKEDAGK